MSVPTLLSIKALIPGCSEYLLISRFDSRSKVLPSDIFDMAWSPAIRLRYSSPDNRLVQALTVPWMLAQLRYYRPRYCVYLMPSDRTAEQIERDRRFFKASGVKELLGFQEMPPIRRSAAEKLDLQDTEAFRKFKRLWGTASIRQFSQFARLPLLRPSEASTESVARWLISTRKHPDRPLIAISPYSNFPSRDMPDGTIWELARRLVEEAHAEIVMVGGRKDYQNAENILSGLSGHNACGLFSITESAALLKACDLSICTESGPMHLAAAIGAPLLVTFSRINKGFAQWLPFQQQSNILYREVACAGCAEFKCPIAGHPCMNNISADQIYQAATSMLHGVRITENAPDGTKLLTW